MTHSDGFVLDRLLDSDPAIRRQVLRDLTDAAPESGMRQGSRDERTEGAGVRARGLAGGLLLPVLLAACGPGSASPVACTLEARPALNVSVVDSVTAAPIADPLVWVRDGSFVDTLQVFDTGRADGPYERKGVYAVHAEAPGYEDWLQEGVVVTADECHVQTRQIVARMRPAG